MRRPFLIGRSLILRPLAPSDLDEADLAWLNDRHANLRFATGGFPMTLARFSERLDADRSGRSHVLLGIVDLAGQARLGAVLLNAIDWTAHTAVTDLALADERWWTDGHAEEAWALLLDHSFTALGLRKVRTTACAPLATRIAVVEKLGFRLEGTYRAEALVDGEYVDVLAFGLFANEFRAARAGSSQP